MSNLKFYLPAFLFMFVTNAFSQGENRYKGEFYLAGDSTTGFADFKFYTKQGDTIKHGDFFYTQTRSVEEREEYRGIEFEGQYKENSKHGRWVFKQKHFTPSKNPKTKDYSIQYDVDGLEKVIHSNFNNGKAEGTWLFAEHSVESGKIKDTLFFASTSFVNGFISGGFEGKKPGLKAKGKLDGEGFLHGKWKFYHASETGEVVEERIFKNGVWASHKFIFDDRVYELHYSSVISDTGDVAEFDDLSVSDDYFEIVTEDIYELGNNDGSDRIVTQISRMRKASNEFVSGALYCFGSEREISVWQKIPGSDSLKNARVKVVVYPLTSAEEKNLTSALENIQESMELVSEFFEDAQVDISRHSYENITFYHEVFSRYQPVLEKLDEVLTKFKSPGFKYINREKVFPDFFGTVNIESEIIFDFDGEEVKRKHDFPKSTTEDVIYHEDIERVSKEIKQDVSGISEKVNSVLEKFKKEKRLGDKEKLLVSNRDTILNLYNGNVEEVELTSYHEKATQDVIIFIENTFKMYASKDTDERLSIADSLSDCFKKLIILFELQAELPKKLDRLDDLYSRTVWNPYTMTDMEERIKERIYNTFEKDVLPELLKELNSDINCTRIEKSIQKTNEYYKLLVDLREKDTKELEREIRRAGSSTQRADILNSLLQKENQ